jgi:transposase InsO family protein
MIISDTSSHAFEKISIDFYGPLNTTPEGYKYIFTIQDCLSKNCILLPVKHANAEEVAKGLTEKMICYFDPPSAILTDQGTHLQNKLLDEFAKLFGINKYYTTAYHPQSNGSIERMHHTLTEYLRKYVENKTEWNTWVPICQHAYNCTIHEASGYSLIENLAQVQAIVALNMVQAKYRSKFYYDKKLNTQHIREGEMVYALKEPRKEKLDMYYVGPYEITSIEYKKAT